MEVFKSVEEAAYDAPHSNCGIYRDGPNGGYVWTTDEKDLPREEDAAEWEFCGWALNVLLGQY